MGSFRIPENDGEKREEPAAVPNSTVGVPSKLSSKRQRMMKRAHAVEEHEISVGEKVQESIESPQSKPSAKGQYVKSKVRLFQEKSQSLDLDNQRPEYNKNNVKLMNQECYNRARQKGLQRNHSMNIDADLVEERKVRREVRKLNAWLIQKSMEHQERQEWSKTEFLRSRTTTITEKKTLLPESAFKSFDSSSIVSSIEDEIHKLTIEADVHNGNVMLEPETNKVSESDSDLLLEAKLIRTDGKLAKLASIDELIEYEQGERG